MDIDEIFSWYLRYLGKFSGGRVVGKKGLNAVQSSWGRKSLARYLLQLQKISIIQVSLCLRSDFKEITTADPQFFISRSKSMHQWTAVPSQTLVDPETFKVPGIFNGE